MPNMNIATAGIILFILLPPLRVLLMLVVYIRDRDHRLAITAAVVLTLILLGFFMGTHFTGISDSRMTFLIRVCGRGIGTQAVATRAECPSVPAPGNAGRGKGCLRVRPGRPARS